MGDFRRRRRDSSLRAVAARLLCGYAGLTQRGVADALAMGTGSAVGRQLRSLPGRVAGNRRLKRAMREAEERLRRLQATNCNGVNA